MTFYHNSLGHLGPGRSITKRVDTKVLPITFPFSYMYISFVLHFTFASKKINHEGCYGFNLELPRLLILIIVIGGCRLTRGVVILKWVRLIQGTEQSNS